jgi:membrane-associated phospholipid phosphatase
VLAAAFVVLTALVWTGALTSVDRVGLAHLMPGLDRTQKPTSFLQQQIPFRDPDGILDAATDAVTLPGHALLSTALVVWLAWRLPSRRLAILAAFAGAVLVEIAFKHVITRPKVWVGDYHDPAFDNSFPSGHATRLVFVALLAVTVWRRTAPWVAGWVLAALALLELDAFHLPSDIVGGVLLALLAALLAGIPYPPFPFPLTRAGRTSLNRAPRGSARS